jgi:hypothetical protein
MTIRDPIDLAAAAITAEGAVDRFAEAPARRPATFASTPVFGFASAANPIRVALLPEAAPAAPEKKRIPGQTYH